MRAPKGEVVARNIRMVLLASAVLSAVPAFAEGSQPAPTGFAVLPVSPERTLAGFIDLCVGPHWQVSDVRKAAKTSDLAFVELHNNLSTPSFSWRSPYAYLALEMSPRFSQCALSIASTQPLTGKQLIAMLKPVIEAEVGHPVQENDVGYYYLEWTDSGSKYVYRVTLAEPGSDPQQGIWYVFDRSVPGERERRDRQMPGESPHPE